MDVLISWSGRQSRHVADVLYEWLRKVIPSLKPWISTQDINKGDRWLNELQSYLPTASACVVCSTPENLDSPWLYWETGAITLAQERPIFPLLIGMATDEIEKGPLGQFQCTHNRKDDVWLLVRSLNQRLDSPEDEMRLKGIFETHWPELHREFETVVKMGMPNNIVALLSSPLI